MAKSVGDAGAIPTEKISVIVAFKNEEHNLVALIQSIDAQNYPKECFEVILVDDNSNDRSVLVVREAIKGLSNFKLITTHSQDSGKKKALTNGVNQVSAGIIVTTDADCIVPPNWLTRINKTFYRYQPTLIFGGVKIIDRKSLFSSLQQLEFSSLIASGAATNSFGKTSMCNAANLAFSKEHFDKVGGYEGNFEIASGDDEFLMRKMLTSYPGSVVFMNHQDAIVSTQPQPTIKAFIHQRLRSAAKLPHNPSLSTKVLAWYVILFQSSYLLIFGLTFANSISLELSITLFGGKLLLEFLFLRKAVSFLQTKFSFIGFFILQFLYPLYVVYVGIASNFISYQWKGNRYKA